MMLRRFAWGGGEELIKRGVFGQFDTFFLSPPRWWGRYSSLLHEDMDIPAPFLFYEGRKKILMKRGIGDPFETKALSGRTTSLLPPMRFRVNFIGEAAMKDG